MVSPKLSHWMILSKKCSRGSRKCENKQLKISNWFKACFQVLFTGKNLATFLTASPSILAPWIASLETWTKLCRKKWNTRNVSFHMTSASNPVNGLLMLLSSTFFESLMNLFHPSSFKDSSQANGFISILFMIRFFFGLNTSFPCCIVAITRCYNNSDCAPWNVHRRHLFRICRNPKHTYTPNVKYIVYIFERSLLPVKTLYKWMRNIEHNISWWYRAFFLWVTPCPFFNHYVAKTKLFRALKQIKINTT